MSFNPNMILKTTAVTSGSFKDDASNRLQKSGVYVATITEFVYLESAPKDGKTIGATGIQIKAETEEGKEFDWYLGASYQGQDGNVVAKKGVDTALVKIFSFIFDKDVSVSVDMSKPNARSRDGVTTGTAYDFVAEKAGKKARLAGRKIGVKIQFKWGEQYPEKASLEWLKIDSKEWVTAKESEHLMPEISGVQPVGKKTVQAFDPMTAFKTAVAPQPQSQAPVNQPQSQPQPQSQAPVDNAEFDDDVPF